MILALVGLLQETVAIPASAMTGKQLATALTSRARIVTADPEVSDRGYAIVLRARPWTEVVSLLEENLGLKFQSNSAGHWRIEVDQIEKERERSQFARYISALDRKAKDGIRQAYVLGKGLPGQQPQIDELTKKITAIDKTGRSDMKPADENGARILLGVSSSYEGPIISGPSISHFERLSVRGLVPKDALKEGNMYYWRDGSGEPQWVRDQATSFARKAETAYDQRQDLTPNQKREALDRIATGVQVIHRLHFEPKNGEVSFQFFMNQAKLMDSAWQNKGTLRPFSLLLGPAVLKNAHEEGPEREQLAARIGGTETALKSINAAQWVRDSENPGFSAAMLQIAEKAKRDLIMEIHPMRDNNPLMFGKRIGDRGVPAVIGPWITTSTPEPREDKPDPNRWIVPGYTLKDSGDLLTIRSEWKFIDRQYRIPLGPILEARDFTSKLRTPLELAALAGKLNEEEIALAATNEVDPDNSFVLLFPVLKWMDKLPPNTKEKLVADLVAKKQVFLPVEAAGTAAASRLQTHIQGWVRHGVQPSSSVEEHAQALAIYRHGGANPWAWSVSLQKLNDREVRILVILSAKVGDRTEMRPVYGSVLLTNAAK